jgi:hypothetical protein
MMTKHQPPDYFTLSISERRASRSSCCFPFYLTARTDKSVPGVSRFPWQGPTKRRLTTTRSSSRSCLIGMMWRGKPHVPAKERRPDYPRLQTLQAAYNEGSSGKLTQSCAAFPLPWVGYRALWVGCSAYGWMLLHYAKEFFPFFPMCHKEPPSTTWDEINDVPGMRK